MQSNTVYIGSLGDRCQGRLPIQFECDHCHKCTDAQTALIL